MRSVKEAVLFGPASVKLSVCAVELHHHCRTLRRRLPGTHLRHDTRVGARLPDDLCDGQGEREWELDDFDPIYKSS